MNNSYISTCTTFNPLNQQDKIIDKFDIALVELQNTANEISDEVKHQNKNLKDLETGIINADDNVKKSIVMTKSELQNKECCGNCGMLQIIGILILLIIGAILIIIYS